MAANGSKDEKHLRLVDLSDMRVLEFLEQALDADGMASTADVAAQFETRDMFPKRMIGARFAWLKRYGYIDRDQESGRWFFTAEGRRIYDSRNPNARDRKSIERLENTNLGALAEVLTQRMIEGSPLEHDAIRRGIQHGQLRRKAGYR